MNKQELIESLRNEYIQGLITEDYYKGKNRGINIALGLVNQLDEPEQVVCAENERTTEIVEVPQMIGAYIKKERVKDTLGNIAEEIYNSEESWSNLSEEYKWMRLNFTLFSRAWLYGYTIEPPKTLQVIFKNYDSTVYKTDIPEDEAMKLIEGWKE